MFINRLYSILPARNPRKFFTPSNDVLPFFKRCFAKFNKENIDILREVPTIARATLDQLTIIIIIIVKLDIT